MVFFQKNWNSFLRCDDNKKELFPFLSKAVIKQITTPQILATIGNEVISSQENVNINNDLAPCNHEEGDARMLVHAKHAAKFFPRILLKTVDTDVVVIALSCYHDICKSKEMWIELKFYSVCRMQQELNELFKKMSSTVEISEMEFHSIEKFLVAVYSHV